MRGEGVFEQEDAWLKKIGRIRTQWLVCHFKEFRIILLTVGVPKSLQVGK